MIKKRIIDNKRVNKIKTFLKRRTVAELMLFTHLACNELETRNYIIDWEKQTITEVRK